MKKQNRNNNPSRQASGPGDVITKLMTLSSQSVVTNAGGIIAVATGVTSAQVQAGPAAEWASFAARYQQYRVRKVRVRMCPVWPVSSGPVAAGAAGTNTGHSSMYVADYIGSSVPTTAAQVLSDEFSRVVCTYKPFTFEAGWARNPNAKLWNPTSAAVPTANLFGIAWASSTLNTILFASIPYFTYDVEWEVEFRGSQ